ncbi:hypothetical protein GCM10009633_25630 [Janibacter melonis]
MGHIPVGMEMFSAADEEQWKIIARHIDESDYYAVIVAQRYGSMTEEQISFTRKEYEYARSRGIPCLGFILDEKASWPSDRLAKDDAERERLDEFKALVKEKPVMFWKDGPELHGKFSISLMKAFTAQPREGWIRSSGSVGPEAMAEVVRLSAENADLRQRLEQAEGASAHERRELVKKTGRTLVQAKSTLSHRERPGGPWQRKEVTLFDVFRVAAPQMVVEHSIIGLSKVLAMEIREDPALPWDTVATNQVKLLMSDFMTLDLVQPSERRHTVSDTNEYWTLTSLGMDVLKFVRRHSIEHGIAQAAKPDEEAEKGSAREDDLPESETSAPTGA